MIEFNVIRSSILCSVFSLEFKQVNSSGQTNLNKFLSRAKSTSRVECVFLLSYALILIDSTYKGRPIEIVDDLNVETKSGRLLAFMNTIEHSLDSVRELTEKLNTVLS